MLNDYKDEARRFLASVAPDDRMADIIKLFPEELRLLEDAVQSGDTTRASHQIYDLLFLLMEMAAVAGVDLDAEWRNGRERKRTKYSAESHGDNPHL
jgi:hypothetical protein